MFEEEESLISFEIGISSFLFFPIVRPSSLYIALFQMSKPPSPAILVSLVTLVVFICVMSAYNISVYKSCTPSSDSSSRAVIPTALLNIPSGNCNCTVSYTQEKTPMPALSCQCRNSTSSTDVSATSTSTCPACPPPEVRIVEKEVIKEVNTEENCHKGSWYAEGKPWHYPMRFPLCSMDACFNYSRCENSSELLMYAYDVPSPPVRWFSRIQESKYYTNDPEKACLFLAFLDNDTPWPPHPKTLPYWNEGVNHVLVIFADKWSQRGPAQDTIGMASVMGSDIHETIYRAGFDISIPLPGNQHMVELQSVKPLDRKYFLTFRGLRYLGAAGEGTFRSHDSFREMHNGKDVIVATSCNHGINDMIRKEDPKLGVHCDEDNLVHSNYSFNDLMNSTFGLVPAGIQPASYRFIEVLSAGTIPVLVADNYVKPFDTLIHWHTCLLQFPTTEMHRIVATVRAMKQEEILKRQANCLRFYNEFLKDDETLLRSAVRALKARFLGAIANFSEVKKKR